MTPQELKSKAETVRDHFQTLKVDLYTAAEESGDPAMVDKVKQAIEPLYNDARDQGIKAALGRGDDRSRAAAGAKVAEDLQSKINSFVEANPALKEALEKRQGTILMSEFNIIRNGTPGTERAVLHQNSLGDAVSMGPENLPGNIPFESGKSTPVSDYAMRMSLIKSNVGQIKEATMPAPSPDTAPMPAQPKQTQQLQM